MANVLRLLSLFLLLMAAAVGVNYIITVLYDDGSTGFPIWSIFNWPMAAGVVIAFAVSACHWRQQGRAEANMHSSAEREPQRESLVAGKYAFLCVLDSAALVYARLV